MSDPRGRCPALATLALLAMAAAAPALHAQSAAPRAQPEPVGLAREPGARILPRRPSPRARALPAPSPLRQSAAGPTDLPASPPLPRAAPPRPRVDPVGTSRSAAAALTPASPAPRVLPPPHPRRKPFVAAAAVGAATLAAVDSDADANKTTAEPADATLPVDAAVDDVELAPPAAMESDTSAAPAAPMPSVAAATPPSSAAPAPATAHAPATANAPAKANAPASGDGAAQGDSAMGRAAPPGPPPYQLVRMLTALQDDIARGSAAALNAQRVLSRGIDDRLLAAAAEEWTDRRNANALVIYALSGGRPAVVAAVRQQARLSPPYDELVAGALAYLEGRAGDAARHFAQVDPATVDYSVRAPLLLARAALTVGDDPAAARALLDRARAAAPGTLVEEAALRRAVLIAAEADDLDDFDHLVNRYLRKFRSSIYAGNFRQRVAAAVTRMSFITEPSAVGRLEAILAPMTDGGRQELYLLLARAAIERGNHVAAAQAARRVQEMAAPDTLDHRRARLYEAAADIVDPVVFAQALRVLRQLQQEDLPPDDHELLTAALKLSSIVTDLPPAAPPRGGDAGPAPAPSLASGAGDRSAAQPAPRGAQPASLAAGAGALSDADGQAPHAAAADDVELTGSPALDARIATTLAAVDTLLRNAP